MVAVMYKKIKLLLKDNRGETNLLIPILFLIGIIFFVVILIFTTLMVRRNQGYQAINNSLKSCETINYQNLYSDMIEASSYNSSTNYNSGTFTQGFYDTLNQFYPYINETANDDGTKTFDVCNSSGTMLFQLSDISLNISPKSVSMPDGLTTRLVYTVTGDIIVHYDFFSSKYTVTFPIKQTATYQYLSSN
jgi:hypothetical protein